MSFELDSATLVLVGLATTRTLSFIMAAPILGVRGVPVALRVGLGLWMGIALLPGLQAAGARAPQTPELLALAVATEVLVGMLLAFAVVLTFASVQYAGQIIGVQIGFSLANVIDPQNESQVSIVGQVYNLITVLIFLAVDGPVILMRSLHESFTALSPGSFYVSAAGVYDLVGQFGALFSLSLRIALPVVLTLLLVSVTMGIVGRTVPQLNILVMGFPLKILVGCLMLAASVPFFGDLLQDVLGRLPAQIDRLSWALATGR